MLKALLFYILNKFVVEKPCMSPLLRQSMKVCVCQCSLNIVLHFKLTRILIDQVVRDLSRVILVFGILPETIALADVLIKLIFDIYIVVIKEFLWPSSLIFLVS